MTRKEAIEILKRNKPTSDPRRCGTELCEAVDMAIEALQEPQVGGWIPVSERLPKDCGEDWVLVQIKEKDCGFLWIPRVGEERNGKWWLTDDEKPLEDMFEVIAWQPLPEPYKESEEE